MNRIFYDTIIGGPGEPISSTLTSTTTQPLIVWYPYHYEIFQEKVEDADDIVHLQRLQCTYRTIEIGFYEEDYQKVKNSLEYLEKRKILLRMIVEK